MLIFMSMISLKRIIKEIMEELPSPPAIVQQQPNVQQTNVINQSVITNAYVVAATLWGEARGEGEAGMQAVLNVIMNRAGGDFNNAAKVSLKPKQFSVWNGISDPQEYSVKLAEKARAGKLQDEKMYNKAMALVDKAIKRELKDVTGGATFYFNPKKVQPNWAKNMRKTATIGNHDFYKPATTPPKSK